jgi:hypothetical protein
MYLTLHFILSHLIADYTAQPGKLVKYKYESFCGILLHTLIHLAIIMILIWPFMHLYSVCLASLAMFATHTLIDYSKIKIETKFPKINKFLIYVSDQVAHLIVILIVVRYIGMVEPGFPWEWVKIYTNRGLIDFLIVLNLSTYFWDITRWAYLNSKKPQPYKRDYRLMARNAIIVVAVFTIYWAIK